MGGIRSRVPYALALAWACTAVWACAFEFSERKQREHGSVGAEIYRVVCMDLAAQVYPNDLTGNRFASRCEGRVATSFEDATPKDEAQERALARFNTLLARRDVLVAVLDAVFEADAFEDDEIRAFLGKITPLYDPPAVLPAVTREVAALLEGLLRRGDAVSEDAILALERLANRDGYRPLPKALGLTRALAYPGLDELVDDTLAALAPLTGAARGPWQDLLQAAALDLATADGTPASPAAPGTLSVARKLLFTSDDVFSSGRAPLFVAARDLRGIVQPQRMNGTLPLPFRDADQDGLADVDARGRLVLTPAAPSPFVTLAELLAGTDATARDAFGRALRGGASQSASCNGAERSESCSPALLYDYVNADESLLAGLTRELGPLLEAKPSPEHGHTRALQGFALGLNVLLGEYVERTWDEGSRSLRFLGPDTSTGPLFDLLDAITRIVPLADTDALLEVLTTLLRDHERELTGLIEAALYIDERADAHPEAHWEAPHEFWDDLIAWAQRANARPGMLEAMLRALTTEEMAKAGPLMGNFMRFKDRVSYPMGKREELEALGIDMKQVVAKLGDADVAEAVQTHRAQVNYPCQNPPTSLVGGDVADPSCTPLAPYPAKNHRGIRNCPAEKPIDGSSCASAAGVGLCSWDEGACTCDCDGGLCRGDMTPTWTCHDAEGTPLPSTPGYARWVDRTQPDSRVGVDGQSNQSLFQRTAALVHDLHVPGELCNRDGATMKVFTPAGSNAEILGGALGTAGGLLGPYERCKLLYEPQIVQFFARAILGTAELPLRADVLSGMLELVDGAGLGGAGLSSDSLMERQSQIRGLYVHAPTPQAIARMVFSPFNAFEASLLDLPVSRDQKLIVDLHRDTIFAWELADPIARASYYDVLAPLLKAMDEHELRDPSTGELLDGYLFGDLITLVHRHWSSRRSDATLRACEESTTPLRCDLDAPLFAYQSNGVSYEELVAEALVDAQLLARVREVMVALDQIEVEPGVDGITVLARGFSNLLDPTKWCSDGDCAKHPLAYRDGRTTTKTNTGKLVEHVTPLHLLLDALNDIDQRFDDEHREHLGPWRAARSELVDLLLDVDRSGPGQTHFRRPRSRALLVHLLDFGRERIASYRARDEACREAGGSACRALEDWAHTLTPRLERSIGQPVIAATLRLLDTLARLDGDPGGKLLELVRWVLHEHADADADNEVFDTALLSLHDMLQIFEDAPSSAKVMRFAARAIAPNAIEFAQGKQPTLQLEAGAVEKTLTLLREMRRLEGAAPGRESTPAKLLRMLVEDHGAEGASPIEVILDTIAEVNRARPGADLGRPLDAADFRAVLDETRSFLSSDRHGLERLYDIIEARRLP